MALGELDCCQAIGHGHAAPEADLGAFLREFSENVVLREIKPRVMVGDLRKIPKMTKLVFDVVVELLGAKRRKIA